MRGLHQRVAGRLPASPEMKLDPLQHEGAMPAISDAQVYSLH